MHWLTQAVKREQLAGKQLNRKEIRGLGAVDHRLNVQWQQYAAEKKVNAILRYLSRSRVCNTHKATSISLSAREASPGALCSPAGITLFESHGPLERVQRKGRRTIRGLKPTTCEGRWNTVGLLALKTRQRGNMITASQCIKGGNKDKGKNVLSMSMTKKTRKTCQQRQFESQIMKNLFNSTNSQALEQTTKTTWSFSRKSEVHNDFSQGPSISVQCQLSGRWDALRQDKLCRGTKQWVQSAVTAQPGPNHLIYSSSSSSRFLLFPLPSASLCSFDYIFPLHHSVGFFS